MNRRPFFLAGVLGFSPGPGTPSSRDDPPPDPSPVSLPIFRLEPPKLDEKALQLLAKQAFGIEAKVTPVGKDRLRLVAGNWIVELYTVSGGIWAADRERLWNPDLSPDLPDADKARTLADEFLKATGLLSRRSPEVAFVRRQEQPSTQVAFFDVKSCKRTGHKLDIQVNYVAQIKVAGAGGKPLTLPVVGGGGEFNVILGDKGKVIGFSGVWRPIDKIEKEAKLVSKEVIHEAARKMLEVRGVKIIALESSLAYYSAPASEAQAFLYPVWVVRARVTAAEKTFDVRTLYFSATERPPAPPAQESKRTPSTRPDPCSLVPEESKDQVTQREAGASWQRVGPAEQNVDGFLDGLRNDGWTINFNWGEADAWESDWNAYNNDWVDAADIVFFTGHASKEAWLLVDATTGVSDPLTADETAPPKDPEGDLWGNNDVEWIIIAACGPLQDEVVSHGDGSAIQRRKDAFNGLHQLLGYASVSDSTPDEGKLFVRYCLDGETVINSWFRTAKEVQPPETYAAVMYACDEVSSPFEDCLWGHGTVAPDPVNPTQYVVMWSPC